MIIAGVPYSCQKLSEMGEVSGGSPYGATTLANTDGSRQPSENELAIARFQGERVARDRKSTRLNSSHIPLSRMPSSA